MLRSYIVRAVTGKKAIKRSKKGTGFDYWVGDTDDDELIFSNKARLEVSGILKGTDTEIAGRLKKKNAQVQITGNLGAPAYVAIIARKGSVVMGPFDSWQRRSFFCNMLEIEESRIRLRSQGAVSNCGPRESI